LREFEIKIYTQQINMLLATLNCCDFGTGWSVGSTCLFNNF
jgi:hypothetical protein